METATARVYNQTQCKEASLTVRDAFYLVPSLLNTFSAIASFGVCGLIYKRFGFRIYYHINAKILIFLNMLSFLTLSLATISSYGTLFTNALVASQDCELLFFTQNCSFLRRMFLFSIMLTTMTHASLILERAFATYKLGAYEHMGSQLGVILGVLSVVTSLVIVGSVTSREDYDELLTNCFAFSSSASIGDHVYYMFRFQLILEIGTWVVYICLLDYHKRSVRKQSEGIVGDRFQGLENMIVLQQLGPLILTSSAIIGLYILTSSTGRFFRSAFTLPHYKQFVSSIFIMPHNALISMILYYLLFKWGFEEKDKRMKKTLTSPLTPRKAYMEHLKDYWNENYHKRTRDSGQYLVARAHDI